MGVNCIYLLTSSLYLLIRGRVNNSLQQSLEMRKKLLGEKHPDVAISLNNLAKLHYSQKNYPKAEPLYIESLEMATKLLGKEHPTTQKINSNLLNLRKKIKQ